MPSTLRIEITFGRIDEFDHAFVRFPCGCTKRKDAVIQKRSLTPWIAEQSDPIYVGEQELIVCHLPVQTRVPGDVVLVQLVGEAARLREVVWRRARAGALAGAGVETLQVAEGAALHQQLQQLLNFERDVGPAATAGGCSACGERA